MKKLIAVSLFSILFASCHKKPGPLKINLCDSPECQNYEAMWKKMFLEKNNMSEAYFNDHITVFDTRISSWREGSSFNIRYQVKIDWLSTNLSDGFLVKTNPGETLYPALKIRRDGEYLSEEEVRRVLEIYAFSSFPIAVVRSVDHLVFRTEKDAIDAMEVAAGVRKISNTNSSIDAKNINPAPSGEPFMGGSHQKSKKVNECVSVNLNLVTGKCLVSKGPCWVE